MFTTLFTLCGLGCALIVSVAAQSPMANRQVDETVFPGIAPSESLEWHDCYEVFKCARLSVPANVHHPQRWPCDERVELAIIWLPYIQSNASMPAESVGTIHVQLGGWSASSTNFLVRFGETYTPLLAGYDLLAIDYRGYGWSTPSINCFASEADRQAFALAEPPVFGSSPDPIDTWVSRAQNFSQLCKANARHAIEYSGSYAAAIDHITVMKLMNQTKLNFWAITSGSIVASTIAYSHPEYVGKFLFDAPASPELDYTVTNNQAYHIEDADKSLTAFLYTCLHADPMGPAPCNFTGNSTTLEDIRARFDKIESSLRDRTDGGIAVAGFQRRFDWSVFKYVETLPLFVPALFPVLAGVLSELEAGEYIGFVPFALANFTYQPPPPLPMLTEDPPFDGLLVGPCVDAATPLRDVDQFEAYFKDLDQKVPSVAPVYAGGSLFCEEFGIRAVNRYCGGFSASLSEHGDGKVVILNNRGDPFSSIKNAERIKDSFGGKGAAVVVESIAAGHTSFVAASDCLYKVIGEFFGGGVVPEDGFKCGPDIYAPPFGVDLPADFQGCRKVLTSPNLGRFPAYH